MTSDGFPRMVASCDNLPNGMWRDLILCVRVFTLSVDWSIQHPVGDSVVIGRFSQKILLVDGLTV